MYNEQDSTVFQAMGASSEAYEWLKQTEREERDWNTVFHLSKIAHALQTMIALRPVPNDSEAGKRVDFVVCCFSVITSMTGTFLKAIKDDLPNISDSFRAPIQFLVAQLDEMLEAVYAIAELWEMRADADLSLRLSSAIQQIDRTKDDIPDWRRTLELVSD